MCWRKWAKKHEIEELKEGMWFEPVKALLNRKVTHRWTAKAGCASQAVGLEPVVNAKKAVRHKLDGQQVQVLRSRRYGKMHHCARNGERKETRCQGGVKTFEMKAKTSQTIGIGTVRSCRVQKDGH